MRYLYKRDRGARRRVMHICGYDPMTGQPTMQPFCGRASGLVFDTTINPPFGLGRPICKRCRATLR
jgi:hypothetical protein